MIYNTEIVVDLGIMTNVDSVGSNQMEWTCHDVSRDLSISIHQNVGHVTTASTQVSADQSRHHCQLRHER